MALYDYNGDFFKFVNDLIDGKVDGDFNPTASSYNYELNSDNFSGAAFNGLEDMKDQFWEQLIEYMKNENEYLQHSIVRDNDWQLESNMQTVFEYINNKADLDNGADLNTLTNEDFGVLKEQYEVLSLNNYDTYNEYISNNSGDELISEDLFNQLKEINEYSSYKNYVRNNIEPTYLSYIQNYIDEEEPHWNESLTALINYYQNNFGDNMLENEDIEYSNSGYVIDSNGKISMGTDSDGNSFVNFRIDDIISGDAGNYFARADEMVKGIYSNIDVTVNEDYKDSYSKNIIPEKDSDGIYRINKDKTWVRPWFNIDGSTYSIERGNDKIKRVLNDNKNLQFTRYKENEQDYINAKLSNPSGIDDTLEKYLRLIMPMYERIVEIEDLDRNFWVIAQILSGLSAYLTGDDSPIGDMFAGLIDEVTQLWENILYLWVAMGLISQEPYYTDIKELFVPVYNTEEEPYVKYDNFTSWNSTSWSQNNDIENYCLSLLKKMWVEDKNIISIKSEYNESNLVIIPEVREKNYFDNYYSRVVYPGAIVYDRNHKETYYIVFSTQKPMEKYVWPDMTGDGTLSDSIDFIVNGKAVTENFIDNEIALIIYTYAQISGNFVFEDYYNESHSLMVEGIPEKLIELGGSSTIEVNGEEYNVYNYILKCIDNVNVRYFNMNSIYDEVAAAVNDSQKFCNLVYEENSDWQTYTQNWLRFFYVEYVNGSGESVTLDLAYQLLVFYELVKAEVYEDTIEGWIDFLYTEEGVKLKSIGTTEVDSIVYIDLTTNNEIFTDQLSSFQEYNTQYYFSDFSSTTSQYMIGAIRTILNLNTSVTSDYYIQFNSLSFDFHDVGRVLKTTDSLLGTAAMSSTTKITGDANLELVLSIEELNSIASDEGVDITRGYYLGELCSYINSPKIQWDTSVHYITYTPDKASSNINSFVSYMKTSSAFSEWKEIVLASDEVSELSAGEAKIICSQSYYTGETGFSIFSMLPYLTLVYKDFDDEIYIYSFLMEVSNSDKITSAIKYPFVSSSFNYDGKEGTHMLGQFWYAYDGGVNGAFTFDSSDNSFHYNGSTNSTHLTPPSTNQDETHSAAPIGNLLYGTMRLTTIDNVLCLKNFIVYCLDRSYLGSSDISDSVPYYYYCTVNEKATLNSFGSIDCTCNIVSNSNDLKTLAASNGVVTWPSDWLTNGHTSVTSVGDIIGAESGFARNYENTLTVDLSTYNELI